MAYRVTWHGHEPYEGTTYSFRPGETRYFASREHVPHELLMDHRFRGESVPAEEALEHEAAREVELAVEGD